MARRLLTAELIKSLPELVKPQLVNGSWYKPKISSRQAADLRKQFVAEGKEWPIEDPVKQERPLRMKGHKRDRVLEERSRKVAKAMEDMPKKIQEYKANLNPAPSFLDKILLTPKVLKLKMRPQK